MTASNDDKSPAKKQSNLGGTHLDPIDLGATISGDDLSEALDRSNTDSGEETPSPVDINRTVNIDELSASNDNSLTVEGEDEPISLSSTRAISEDDLSNNADNNRTVSFEEISEVVDNSLTFNDGDGPVDLGKTCAISDEFAPPDVDNNRTVTLDDNGQESVLSKTIDSRTINMDMLEGPERTAWENAVSLDNSQTMVSHVVDEMLSKSALSKSNNLPGMESNLLIVSRSLRNRSEAGGDAGTVPEYEIQKELGRGGMGTVYAARQMSLDRVVAIKVVQSVKRGEGSQLHSSGKFNAAEKHRREQFLSEAVVTGDLDHPNIVPIHDVAKTPEGNLFYSMKLVEGTPWDKVIAKKSVEDNIDILLKVADALAFAHSRGVVHRDVKPENVMLGEFGVVMLMDWGLAVPTPEFRKRGTVRQATSLGGSPAYMAPELAIGPIPEITASSDIYLLGAVLYQIIAGHPPHTGSGITQCLHAAVANIIQPVAQERQGELYHIAMKAMATLPADRYSSVQDLQTAIRNYRSHSESINLSERAAEDIQRGQESGEYADYARAVFAYEEALELWSENSSAQNGIIEARLAYAETALHKEDYDFGLSLLDHPEPAYEPMITLLKQGQTDRRQRSSRLKAFRRVAAALVAIIFIGGSGMSWKIFQTNQKLTDAVGTIDKANETIKTARATVETLETSVALKQQELQVEQDKVAVAQKEAESKIKQASADAASKIMLAEKEAAVKINQAASQVDAVNDKLKLAQSELRDTASKIERAQAVAAKAEADAAYVNYASAISQARSYIDENQHGQALQILKEVRKTQPADKPLGWEWQRLWYEANRARKEASATGVLLDGRSVRFGSSGKLALATYDNGGLELISVVPNGENIPRRVPTPVPTSTAALSPDELQIAAAGNDGIIRILDTKSGQVEKELNRDDFNGAAGSGITAVRFLTNDLILAGSRDATIRLWSISAAKELGVCWNIAPVLDLSVVSAHPAEGWLVASAVSDLRNGRVVVWHVTPDGKQEKFERVADLLSHTAPVLTVAFNPDGQTIASGDQSGKILLWNWQQVGKLDYHDRISKAVQGLRTGKTSQPITEDPAIRYFFDPDLSGSVRRQSASGVSRLAHRDAIQQLRFSPDGRTLASASNDLTLKIWNVNSGKLTQTLRGQGGPVRSVDFSPVNAKSLLSAGSGGLFSWDLDHAKEMVMFREEQAPSENLFTVHNDEILSAAFDRSGTRIVTASRDHTARVLEIDPQRLEIRQIADLKDEAEPHSLGELREGADFVSLSMHATADNSRLFVGGADGIIRVWNVARAIEVGALTGTGLNSAFAISADGRLVLSGSSDPEAKAILWTVNEQGQPSRTPKWKLNGHRDTVTAFAVSRDGRTLFTGDRQGMGILWDTETGLQKGDTLKQHAGSRVNAVVFSNDGRQLFIAGDNRTVSRVNAATGAVIEVLPHDGFVTDLSESFDGQQLLTVSQIPGDSETKTRLLLWNLDPTGKGSTSKIVDEIVSRRVKSGVPPKNNGEIRSIRFSHDSALAYCTVVDPQTRKSTLKIWSITPNAEPQLTRALAFPRKIAAAEIAMPGPPGKIFTLNGDAVFLWDLEQLQHLKSYRSHAMVTQASFSSDGKFIATSSRTVKIWNVATEKSLAQLEFPHEGAIRSVAFTPVPGQYQLATAGDDGNVKLWDWNPETANVVEVRKFVGTGTTIRRVCFSPDGKSLLAVGDAGFARIWNTDGSGTALVIQDPDGSPDYLSCAITPDKKWVVTGAKDRVARLWKISDDMKSASIVRRFAGHADEITDVKFIASDGDSDFRIASASRDTLVRIWDPRIGSLEENVAPRELLALRGHSLGVTAVDIADDGRLLMSAGLDGEIILWPSKLNP